MAIRAISRELHGHLHGDSVRIAWSIEMSHFDFSIESAFQPPGVRFGWRYAKRTNLIDATPQWVERGGGKMDTS